MTLKKVKRMMFIVDKINGHGMDGMGLLLKFVSDDPWADN
ncbi:MAG: hypothetical protein ACJAY2_002199 [Pseudomonadales bacterium]